MAAARHLLQDAPPPWSDPGLRRELVRLRKYGWAGGRIPPHRALRVLPVPPRKLVPAMLVAIVFFAAWLLLLGSVARLWGGLIDFAWREYLRLGGVVSAVRYDFYGLLSFDVPYLSFSAGLPSGGEWWGGLILTGALVLTSFVLPRQLLPIGSLLRVVAFFQGGAQLFFALWPQAFPYEGSGYVHGMLIAELMLIALVPLLLGLTYYALDFSLGRKMLLTMVIMSHLTLMVPLQYIAHAFVISQASLLFLPLVFFVFGLPLNVLVIISLYAWGVSWRHASRSDEDRWLAVRSNNHDGGNGNVRDKNDALATPTSGEVVTRTVSAVALAFTLGALLAANSAAAELPSRSVEVGGSVGRYTQGFGDANGQFVRVGLWRPDRWTWHFEAGRAERFGDQSLDGGLSFMRCFGRTSLTLGASSGTGDFIAPRYRIDLAASRPLASIVTTLGWTHIQSKGENRSNGVGLSLVRYFPHWTVSAGGRYDLGHPGRTRSTSAGAGLTYSVWRKTYIGVAYDVGDVAYLLVEPGRALVDYRSTGLSAFFSQWFDGRSGVNLKLEYGDTPFYLVRSATVSFFREW